MRKKGKNTTLLRDLLYNKYQLGGDYYPTTMDYDNMVDVQPKLEGSIKQGLGAVPGWGQLTQLGMALGNGVGGDQTNTARTILGTGLNPTKGIFNAIEGKNPLEAIPVLGGIFTARRRRGEERKQKAQETSSELRGIDQTSGTRLDGYDMFGTQTAALGGKLTRLASDIYEVDGNKHSQGGVKLPEQGIELEGDETVSGDYVFSDYLGFADRHKKIAKQLGKIEQKPLTRATRVSVEILRKKEEALKQEQEQVRSALGLGEGAQMLALGGRKPRKYQMGGLTDPDYIPPQATQSEYTQHLDRTLKNQQIKPLTSFKGEELDKVFDTKMYTRDNYNKWKTAWDSGQDVTMDQFGITNEEAKHFGTNPYLKSFTHHSGKVNDLFPHYAGVDIMSEPQFYDRVPLLESAPVAPTATPTQKIGSERPLLAQLMNSDKPLKQKSSLKRGKVTFRPDVNRVGYNKGGRRLGFKTIQ